MADPNDTLDPEPVDAEFEPATDSAEGRKPSRRGPGWLSLITVVLLSTAGGGAAGYAVHTVLSAPASDENTNISEALSGFQDRLTTLEAADNAVADNEARAALAELNRRIDNLPAPATGTPVDLSAVEARLSALENASTTTGSPSDPVDLTAIEARLAALETGVERNAALASQAVDAAQQASAGGVDPQILQDFTARLVALETAPSQAPAAGPDFADPTPRIDALEGEITRLQTALENAERLARSAQTEAADASAAATQRPEDSASARQLAARALALSALREIAMTDEGFEAERAALARVWRGNADLEALASLARAGVPTFDQLRADYPGPAIREAAGPGRVFFGLIAVRQTNSTEDAAGPLALTALAEQRLAETNLDAAITLTEQLDGAALDAARDWLIAARARQDVNRRLTRLRQSLADEAAAQESDPS